MKLKELKRLGANIRTCEQCHKDGLKGYVVGEITGNNPPILFVGEAPGSVEMEQLRPFVGPSGVLLRRILSEIGITEYSLINVLKCRPPNNATPSKSQIHACLGYLHQQIALIEPSIIIALGATATEALTLLEMEEGKDFFRVYHPAYVLRHGATVDEYRTQLRRAIDKAVEVILNPLEIGDADNQVPQLHCHSDYSIGDGIRTPGEMALQASAQKIPAMALTDHGTLAGVYDWMDACKTYQVNGIVGYEGYVRPTDEDNAYRVALKVKKSREEPPAKMKWIAEAELKGPETSIAISLIIGDVKGKDALTKSQAERKMITLARQCIASEDVQEWMKINGYSKILTGDHSSGHHICLWVKNQKGWENLVGLHNRAVTERFYRHPIMTLEDIDTHHEGLAIGSACIGGIVARVWEEDGTDEAYRLLKWIKSRGWDFSMEVMPHPEVVGQKAYNVWVYNVGKELDIPVIITCDAHYSRPSQKEAKINASAIFRRNKEPSEEYFPGNTYHNQTREEIYENLSEFTRDQVDEMIQATFDLSERLYGFNLPKTYPQPSYALEHLYNFQELAEKLYNEFLDAEGEKYKMKQLEELNHRFILELDRIEAAGFEWVYLTVYEMIKRAKEAGIIVGPGRGSGGGSLIAYVMGITSVNPYDLNLSFDRFLPEGRQDPPDFDIDFEHDRRGEAVDILVNLLREASGEPIQAAHISNYNRWKDRSSVNDACWLYGASPDDLREGHLNPDESAPIYALVDDLTGHIRNKSQHAAGVIAMPNLFELLPLTISKRQNMTSIEFDKKLIENLGLVKFDLLGVTSLDVVAAVCGGIDGYNYVLGEISRIVREGGWEEKALLTMIKENPLGIFQFDTEAGARAIEELDPQSFEELVHIVALNRPGPRKSGLIDLYKRRKAGEPYEALTGTENTHGCIIFQEQVLKLLTDVLGMTPSEADQGRRAISKKKLDKMQALEERLSVQLSNPDLKKLWDEIINWAGYGFNRSHAVCYAWLSMVTAYLKLYETSAFYAALLNREPDSMKQRDILREAKRLNITVIPPRVSEGDIPPLKCRGSGDILELGLTAIKGIGDTTGLKLIEKLESGAPLTKAKKALLTAAGCFGGQVPIENYGLIPSANYDMRFIDRRVNSRAPHALDEIASLQEGQYGACRGIISLVKGKGVYFEDNSKVVRVRTKALALVNGSVSDAIVFRGQNDQYYLLFTSHSTGKPLRKDEYRIGWLAGPTLSKSGNYYYRVIAFNPSDGAYECIIMGDERVILRWGQVIDRVKFSGDKVFLRFGEDDLKIRDIFKGQSPAALVEAYAMEDDVEVRVEEAKLSSATPEEDDEGVTCEEEETQEPEVEKGE